MLDGANDGECANDVPALVDITKAAARNFQAEDFDQFVLSRLVSNESTSPAIRFHNQRTDEHTPVILCRSHIFSSSTRDAHIVEGALFADEAAHLSARVDPRTRDVTGVIDFLNDGVARTGIVDPEKTAIAEQVTMSHEVVIEEVSYDVAAGIDAARGQG